MLCDPPEADAQEANYDESKIPAYTLPDPLVLNDGSVVKSSNDWTKRRGEIVRLFKDHVFGAMPASAPEKRRVEFKLVSESKVKLEVDPTSANIEFVESVFKEFDIVLGVDRNGKQYQVRVLIVLPADETVNVPVFLGYNFQGNHTVHSSEKISLGKIWNRDKKQIVAQAKTRGSKSGRWPLGLIISKGYGVATAYYGDVDPDFDDGFKNGVHPLYPELQNRPDNWTSIGAWAWGLSRMVDFFESTSEVDSSRVAVIGHSRLGKTALWAGATDDRFRIVISNNSGCGGEFLSALHASPTYRMLGLKGLDAGAEMPETGKRIGDYVGYHIREGRHDIKRYDWEQFLSFSSRFLR